MPGYLPDPCQLFAISDGVLAPFPQVSAIFSAAAPIVDTTAITATAKLIFAAVPAATPNAVSNGISAAPPVAATAAIASAAPIIFVIKILFILIYDCGDLFVNAHDLGCELFCLLTEILKRFYFLLLNLRGNLHHSDHIVQIAHAFPDIQSL